MDIVLLAKDDEERRCKQRDKTSLYDYATTPSKYIRVFYRKLTCQSSYQVHQTSSVKRKHLRLAITSIIGLCLIIVLLYGLLHTTGPSRHKEKSVRSTKTNNQHRRMLTKPLHKKKFVFQPTKPNSTYKPICTAKQNHVAYLKVHKTGSTTITNIFQRFAVTNMLTVALPADACWHISFHDTLREKYLVKLNKGQSYDILCQHTVYDKEQFKKILPKDSVYIGSVRQPFDQFISSYMFFNIYWETIVERTGMYGRDDLYYITEYLRDPDRYEPEIFQPGSIALRRMAYDFGVPVNKMNDTAFIRKYIKQLDTDFSLVLINEYWDESLVLMKRSLCWDITDILYNKVRMPRKANPITIPETIRERHRQLASVEYELYRHFYQVFWKKVTAQGPGFFSELLWFKQVQARVLSFCKKLPTRIIEGVSLVIPESEWNKRFEFMSKDCYFMKLDEISLNQILLNQQGSSRRLKVETGSTFKDAC